METPTNESRGAELLRWLLQSHEESRSLDGLRVLVVDDHPAVREVICRFIRHWGGITLEAANGGEAVKLIQTEGLDAVLTDVMMPGMLGYDVAKFARSWNPALVIIVITAFVDVSAAIESLEYCDDYLVKVVVPQRLQWSLREAGSLTDSRSHSLTRSAAMSLRWAITPLLKTETLMRRAVMLDVQEGLTQLLAPGTLVGIGSLGLTTLLKRLQRLGDLIALSQSPEMQAEAVRHLKRRYPTVTAAVTVDVESDNAAAALMAAIDCAESFAECLGDGCSLSIDVRTENHDVIGEVRATAPSSANDESLTSFWQTKGGRHVAFAQCLAACFGGTLEAITDTPISDSRINISSLPARHTGEKLRPARIQFRIHNP